MQKQGPKGTELGLNKTGMQMSPGDMGKMRENTERTTPSSGDGQALAQVREHYAAAADPLGSVPPPLSIKGAVKTGAKMMTGNRPQVFVDKLGERLAFERGGVRLYDALIAKCTAQREAAEILSIEELKHFREEEAEHMAIVKSCIEQLGGDPTAQTPCAAVAGIESMGLMQVVTDPRTTVLQALHAILVAELADHAAWEELIVLARQMGQEDMAARFEEAAANELDHLEHVRQWHQEGTLREARMLTH